MISSEQNQTKNLINESLEMTNSWQDIGDRSCTKGLDDIALWILGSLNDSDKLQIRAKCYKDNTDTDAFYPQIQVIDSESSVLTTEMYELLDSDIKIILPLGISNLAPFVQIEAKVLTAGATPAELSKAFISFNRS